MSKKLKALEEELKNAPKELLVEPTRDVGLEKMMRYQEQATKAARTKRKNRYTSKRPSSK